MQKITIEEYIADRLDGQLEYYSEAAAKAKRRYQGTKFAHIILAAAIPLLSTLITQNNANVMKLVVGLVGVAITILSGMLLLFRYHEIWVECRSTAEALRSEKYLLLTRTGPYSNKGAAAFFIERIESILGAEHTRWQNQALQVSGQAEEEKPEGPAFAASFTEPETAAPAAENSPTKEN
jgi:Protein of unknown function (DUF4231)